MTPARVVITGANRGLGLEFTRQLAARGDRVFALVRDPDRAEDLRVLSTRSEADVSVLECNVTDDSAVEDAATRVRDDEGGVEMIINSAGAMGDRGELESIDLETILDLVDVNTLGPLRVARAFLPLLRRGNGTPPRVINLTSLMGSVADNGSGGSYAYRISKAGLNMAVRNMAHDFEDDGIVAVAIHPGWVQTRMGGGGAPLTPEESVASMIATIEALRPDDSGAFLDRNGEPLPY